mmetsp:Transcript_28458/g.69030  ORF Transcript_28458/g.69030 Transcript_28458/m.69030 type:complete len:157 (+) Transcript_28458:551-1021(+)
MVAIDFEDGSAALVSGMDETLMELGLKGNEDTSTIASEPVESSSYSPVAAMPELELSATSTDTATATPASTTTASPSDAVTTAASITTATAATPIVASKATSKPKKKASSSYQDARDRMRAQQQSEETEPASNPWWTAATYLAQKAKESIISNKNE